MVAFLTKSLAPLLWIAVLVSPTLASTPACEFDYNIITKIGESTYHEAPLRILHQAASSVEFTVANTWTTAPGDSVDKVYVAYQKSDWSNDRACELEEAVMSGKTSHSITAHCTNQGFSVVHIFVSDASLGQDSSNNATIHNCCHPDPEDEPLPTIEYMVVLHCRSTCSGEIPPLLGGSDSTLSTPAPSPAPITSIHSIGCREEEEEPLVLSSFGPGDALDLKLSSPDALCTLVEVSIDVNETVVGSLKPVGRSYYGHDWETYAGDFSSLNFDCTVGSSSCILLPPLPQEGRAYALKAYRHGDRLSDADRSARFLEKTTFGPTNSDIDEFDSFESPEAWLKWQFEMPLTSHRQYFRERVTGWHSETNEVGLLHAGACEQGARYRKYAFLWIENGRYIDVMESPHDPSKLILSVEGQVRTVVNGPMQFGTQHTLYGNATSGRYQMCSNPYEGVGGRLLLRGKDTNNSCRHFYFGGIYGNPAVQFDDVHLENRSVVNLPTESYIPVMIQYFYQDQTEMIFLTDDLTARDCNGNDAFIAGMPERAMIGATSDSNGTNFWLQTLSFKTLDNDVDAPLSDGGKTAVEVTSNATEKRLKAICSSAPRTFLNEDSCILSDDACYINEGKDVDVSLELKNLRKIYDVTGGEAGDDTRYVYAVEGLRNDAKFVDPPCSPGTRSRWIQTLVSSATDCIGTEWDEDTEESFRLLLTSSSDDNFYLRDIFFPSNSAGRVTCAPDDINKFDFKILINGTCFENVHPDHLQVFEFNPWLTAHPGGPLPIRSFADIHNTWVLTFPGWHEMWRWEKNKDRFPNIGRLGDTVKLKALPQTLFREDVAQAFGSAKAITASGKVVVCGSPFEVANSKVKTVEAGPFQKGGFDLRTRYNSTSGSWLIEQKRQVWADIALKSKDQFRQRVAFLLSQILAISPESIPNGDFTESFLSYYDIFTRNAFGNYFDILKEVVYHPLMSHMLTYRDGLSTGYALVRRNLHQSADENFAREIMQLFTIGLNWLNDDGTPRLDVEGNMMRTYTNRDISEFAKVYVGLGLQQARGNMDGYSNQVDPLKIKNGGEFKDHLPKLGLNSQYIGDGYPLCVDLPYQHFMKKGATYRLLGSDPNPQLLNDPNNWDGAAAKRISLNLASSSLAKALCGGDTSDCKPLAKVVLASDIDCDGIECHVHQVRTIHVAEGLWYEYVRPACVNYAFYNDAQTIMKRNDGSWKRFMCGNPKSLDASTVCCKNTQVSDDAWRKELFSGERVTLDTAMKRCAADDGLRLCNDPYIHWRDCFDPSQGGCDGYHTFYWLASTCTLNAKISMEGSVAIVHDHHVATKTPEDVYRMVRNDTKMFFQVDWIDSNLDQFVSDYARNCQSYGCRMDELDGTCQCPVTIEETAAFIDVSEITSVQQLLESASIGAFPPTTAGTGLGEIPDAFQFPPGALTSETVFMVVDSNGRSHYRKNVKSLAMIGNSTENPLVFRNPVSFWSLAEYTERDARYEMDAAIQQYFYHPNVAPFLAVRFAQRLGVSNPSRRYVGTISAAFRKGRFSHGSNVFGSGKYGCLEATFAAVILDREAQSIVLDADPAYGSLQEPYLKFIRIMRSLEFETDSDQPFFRFSADFQELIGQEPHKIPSVFSFFKSDHQPSGPVTTANLVSPESQVLNGPTSVNMMNLLHSTLKYGSSACYNGWSWNRYDAEGQWHASCEIGNNDDNYGNTKYLPTTSDPDVVIGNLATLLTSGRISAENRAVIKTAYFDTLEAGKGEFEAMVNAQQLIVMTPEFHSNGLPKTTGKPRLPPSKPEPKDEPYKAVVFLMLSGGMDSYNVLVPESCTGTNVDGQSVYDQYIEMRGVMALNKTEGEMDLTIDPRNPQQPCERFAIHPELEYMKTLYDDGDLTFFANTGVINEGGMNPGNYYTKTRTRLFDHAGMQEEAKKVDPYNSNIGSGVLGRAKDVLAMKGHVVNAMAINDASVTLIGSPGASVPMSVVSQGGPKTFGRRPGAEKYFEIEEYARALNAETDAFSNIFGETWSEQFVGGIQEGFDLEEYLKTTSLEVEVNDVPSSERYIWQRFNIINKLMQTQKERHADRDVYYVEYGSFDHHDSMKANLKTKLYDVNTNLKRFVEQLKADGLWDSVTVFVASDFARTITPNSNNGSDHAWGGHYWIMGGDVNGGRVLGKYPHDITVGSPLNAGANPRVRTIPTTSWDSIWNGVIEWFGVDEEDMDYCLPNRHNTVMPVEGEGESPLFTASDLYDSAALSVDTKRRLRGKNSMERATQS